MRGIGLDIYPKLEERFSDVGLGWRWFMRLDLSRISLSLCMNEMKRENGYLGILVLCVSRRIP